MGLLSFLFGCDAKGDYRRKGGEWHYKDHNLSLDGSAELTALSPTFARTATRGYYRELEITQSDGATFEALSEHYARDRSHVYYADTYRKAQEYWARRYNRVAVIEGADPATFRYLDGDVGKDTRHVYSAGRPVPVKDVASFVPLGHGFSRDRVAGYYHLYAIPGSDGATFMPLDDHYAKDGRSAFYVDLVYATSSTPERLHSVRIEGADVASFAAVQNGYAKSGTAVFYKGRAVDGADPATFTVPDMTDADVDARDRAATYYEGKRTAP